MLCNGEHSNEMRDEMDREYRMHGGKEKDVQNLVEKSERK